MEYSPAELTDLRSAMVNNETFAAIAVRNSFHLYLKHQSLSLSVMVDGFVRAQQDNGHLLMNDVIYLNIDAIGLMSRGDRGYLGDFIAISCQCASYC